MNKLILTKEKCKQLALLCKSRKEFNKRFNGAYNKSLRNGWSEEICKHMTYLANSYKRCVYAYKFPDNHIYVGLTYNIEERHRKHRIDKKSSVFKYGTLAGCLPEIEKLTDYVERSEAAKLEINIIDQFKNNNWIILNKIKGGGLGGNSIKWTKERCIEVALKCNGKKDFTVRYPGARSAALKNNWLNEINKLFPEIVKTKNYWNEEKCAQEALKYKTKKQFRNKNISAYNISIRNKWLEKNCKHMEKTKIQKGYWNKERCKEEASRYPTRTKFHKAKEGAYKASRKNSWLEEFFPSPFIS